MDALVGNPGLAGIGVVEDARMAYFLAFYSFIGVWTWLQSLKCAPYDYCSKTICTGRLVAQ